MTIYSYEQKIDADELKRLLNRKLSYRDLCRHFGCTKYQLTQRLRQLGLKTVHKFVKGDDGWDEESRAKLTRLVKEGKLTWPQIAVELGRGEDSCHRKAKKWGLVKRKVRSPFSTGKRRWTTAMDKQLMGLVSEIRSWPEIARIMGRGLSRRAVEQRSIRLRIKQGKRLTEDEYEEVRVSPVTLRSKPPAKTRPCIGALCAQAGAVRKQSRPGMWTCDRCAIYARGIA